MPIDPNELEAAKRRRNRTLEQIKQYEEHLDRLDTEKKEKTGTIAGKTAKMMPSSRSESPVHDLFSKIIKAPNSQK